jgi:hypothetical protein
MSWSLIQGVLPIVNRLDQETEKEVRAHKGCRAIQEEEEQQNMERQFPRQHYRMYLSSWFVDFDQQNFTEIENTQ